MTGMLYIIYLFKGKGDASLCGNYRGSELQDQVLEQLLITCSFASCQVEGPLMSSPYSGSCK